MRGCNRASGLDQSRTSFEIISRVGSSLDGKSKLPRQTVNGQGRGGGPDVPALDFWRDRMPSPESRSLRQVTRSRYSATVEIPLPIPPTPSTFSVRRHCRRRAPLPPPPRARNSRGGKAGL